MAISVVSLGSTSSSTGATLTLTVTVPAGALIFVAIHEKTTTAGGTVGDGGTNSYTAINSANPNASTANGIGKNFYAWNAGALSAATLTYTKAGSGNSSSMSAFYATGIQTSADPLDAAVTATPTTGSSTTPSVTSGTPGAAGELMVGAVAWLGATTDTFTEDGAYATPPDSAFSFNTGVGGGNLVNAGSAAKTYAPTITSHPWAAFIYGFKAAPLTGPAIILMGQMLL
jgi:hypothetical protein